MRRNSASAAHLVVQVVTRVFFRRVQVIGTEHVPETGGALLVAWHPNGIVDPALILARSPVPVVFGARHGLFRWPVLGTLMRALGCVPIFRPKDMGKSNPEDIRARNAASLDALARAIAGGACSALFPEGVSHDSPHPLAIKTGAARLYYRARAHRTPGTSPPVIVPVGLHYDRKRVYRSNALVAFHAPIALEAALDVDPVESEPEQAARARCQNLTDRIEEALEAASLATENWELHTLMHRARKLVRAERAHQAGANPGRAQMKEKVVGMARIWTGYRARLETHPTDVEALIHRIREYDADLENLGIEDHELDSDPRLGSPWLPFLLAVQVIGVFLLLPPVVLAGYVLNIPTAAAIGAFAKVNAKERKDEASIKIVAGVVFFPLTWALWAGLAAWGQLEAYNAFPGLPRAPGLAAATMLAMCLLGGGLSVRYARVAQETLRSLRVRVTRRVRIRSLARLRVERGVLCEALLELAEGVELPGNVRQDGRVEWETTV